MEPGHQAVVPQTFIHVEPLVEILGGTEHFGQQEVEQGPQLVEVVLKEGSQQEQEVEGRWG